MQTLTLTSRLMSFTLAATLTLAVLMGLDTIAAQDAGAAQMARVMCMSSQA